MSKNDKPNIVIVDNSPALNKLFEKSTRDLGIELTFFPTANEAWSYLETNQPDLLFLSIILPNKDGISFLKALRKLPIHENTSVIMISSKDYAQDRTAACELGALDYILKPMPMKTIKDIVVKYTKAKPTAE